MSLLICTQSLQRNAHKKYAITDNELIAGGTKSLHGVNNRLSPLSLMPTYRTLLKKRYPESADTAFKAAVFVTHSLYKEALTIPNVRDNKYMREKYVKFYLICVRLWDDLVVKCAMLTMKQRIEIMVETCKRLYRNFIHPNLDELTSIMLENHQMCPISRQHNCGGDSGSQDLCTSTFLSEKLLMIKLSEYTNERLTTRLSMPIISDDSFTATEHNLRHLVLIHNENIRKQPVKPKRKRRKVKGPVQAPYPPTSSEAPVNSPIVSRSSPSPSQPKQIHLDLHLQTYRYRRLKLYLRIVITIAIMIFNQRMMNVHCQRNHVNVSVVFIITTT